MAPPVTKRRKLQHSEDNIGSEFNNGGNGVQEENGAGLAEQTSFSAQDGTRPHKRRDRTIQDGVYTAEVYKSNMFKLQVDELLQQVKPKYGKKEAPAENAMRTLKTIIEQIPNREAVLVRFFKTYFVCS